jgi:hypothetical protein
MTTYQGIILWFLCGLASVLLARAIPKHRGSWLREGTAGFLGCVVLGFVATRLDFGGYGELDWRAGLFIFAGSLALIGMTRLRRARLSS